LKFRFPNQNKVWPWWDVWWDCRSFPERSAYRSPESRCVTKPVISLFNTKSWHQVRRPWFRAVVQELRMWFYHLLWENHRNKEGRKNQFCNPTFLGSEELEVYLNLHGGGMKVDLMADLTWFCSKLVQQCREFW
jgi:hypothetical protein